jgi:hypothetical protein
VVGDRSISKQDGRMILTIITDKEQDLELAGIAAAALLGANFTQAFPDGSASRPSVANAGSIEVQCDISKGPLVRAGFVQAGFDTIERLADPDIAAKTDVVAVAVGPEQQKYLQMADPAADALCGAGLTVAYPTGLSYEGDLFNDSTMNVQCARADIPTVQTAFAQVWKALNPDG